MERIRPSEWSGSGQRPKSQCAHVCPSTHAPGVPSLHSVGGHQALVPSSWDRCERTCVLSAVTSRQTSAHGGQCRKVSTHMPVHRQCTPRTHLGRRWPARTTLEPRYFWTQDAEGWAHGTGKALRRTYRFEEFQLSHQLGGPVVSLRTAFLGWLHAFGAPAENSLLLDEPRVGLRKEASSCTPKIPMLLNRPGKPWRPRLQWLGSG